MRTPGAGLAFAVYPSTVNERGFAVASGRVGHGERAAGDEAEERRGFGRRGGGSVVEDVKLERRDAGGFSPALDRGVLVAVSQRDFAGGGPRIKPRTGDVFGVGTADGWEVADREARAVLFASLTPLLAITRRA